VWLKSHLPFSKIFAALPSENTIFTGFFPKYVEQKKISGPFLLDSKVSSHEHQDIFTK